MSTARKVQDLEGALTLYNVKVPAEWKGALNEYGMKVRKTMHGLVHEVVTKRNAELGCPPEDTYGAAAKVGMSRSQYVRDTLEKAYGPDSEAKLIEPIREWRGGGSVRYSRPHQRGRAINHRLSDAQYEKIAQAYAHWLEHDESNLVGSAVSFDVFAVALAVKAAQAYLTKNSVVGDEEAG